MKWLESRQGELLPVEYFHVVFTVPEEIARIAFYNKAVVYGILFRAAAETLLTIARDPRHGRTSASLAFCTPGGKTCCITPTFTSSYPGVASVPTATGSDAAPDSFCPYVFCRASSADCFFRLSAKLSKTTNSSSSVNCGHSK